MQVSCVATALHKHYEVVGLGVVHGTCSGKERTYIVQVFADLR